MAQAGYKIRNPEGIYFLSCALVQWVDIFTRPVFADVIVESPAFSVEKKGLLVHAWVLISNHIHLIVSSKSGFTLSDISRDFKKFTSGKILKTLEVARIESRKSWMTHYPTILSLPLSCVSRLRILNAGKENSRNEKYQFWQQDNYPIELTDPAMMNQRLDYLHTNPVRSGLVWEPWHSRYSSACDHMNNQKGLVEIDFI